MVGDGQEHDDGRGAMQAAAPTGSGLPEQQRLGPPKLGILQGKARERERRETHHDAPVRDAEPQVHAQHRLAGFAARAAANELGQKVEQVVQQHEAERHRDQHPVRPANVLDHRVVRAGAGLHMDGTDGELGFGHALVALPAGFAEVGGIDGRARIAGTENGVHAMA